MRNSNFKYLFNVLILVLFFYELNCFIIPNINTELIRLPKQSTDLTGNLEPNTLLQNAQYIGEKKLKGPESIVFDDDGNMYTGIATGQIVKVDKNDQNNIQIVTRIGEETDDSICNGESPKKACGRPLGLRLLKERNELYVADAYYGLFKIDLDTGFKRLIIASNDTRFGSCPLKFVNDLDIDGDNIYFVDTSFARGVDETLVEFGEAQPRGRLFKYDQLNDKIELLLQGLYFPNGVTLTPNKDAVLVNEMTATRILKYYINGNCRVEIFANLPGYGDNIRLTEQQTLLVPFAIVKNYDLGKYGLLAEYDLNGKPLKSWHDPTGKIVQGSSQAFIYENKLYLGSLLLDYVAVVDY